MVEGLSWRIAPPELPRPKIPTLPELVKPKIPTFPEFPKPPALPEEEKRIKPDILQIFILDEIVGRLEALESFTEELKKVVAYIAAEMERVSEGIVYPIELTIEGNTITEFNIEEEPSGGHKPWFSCTIYADGPDTLWVAVNTTVKGFSRIENAEAMDVDFHSPKIRKLFFYTVKDGECAVRIIGER